MNEKTVYTCTDQEHDAWVCGKCGYIETLRQTARRKTGGASALPAGGKS